KAFKDQFYARYLDTRLSDAFLQKEFEAHQKSVRDFLQIGTLLSLHGEYRTSSVIGNLPKHEDRNLYEAAFKEKILDQNGPFGGLERVLAQHFEDEGFLYEILGKLIDESLQEVYGASYDLEKIVPELRNLDQDPQGHGEMAKKFYAEFNRRAE